MFVEVNKEAGKLCHVVLFVRGYSFQQFRRSTSTFLLLFKKRIILNPLMKTPHIRPNDAH
jgi:hypothetical protein